MTGRGTHPFPGYILECCMPSAKHRSPDLQWSFELPDRLKLAIADCLTLYSRIESCIVETVWELEQADLERKKEIAKAWGDQNFMVLKKAVREIPGAKTDAIWPALKRLGKERNIIGHGVWMWTNTDRPLVVWHAKFLEEADWVGAEFFDFARFDRFIRRAEVLLNTFARFKILLVKAIDAEKARRVAADEPLDQPIRPAWKLARKTKRVTRSAKSRRRLGRRTAGSKPRTA